MMIQPSKEEYEICKKLKECTDEKKKIGRKMGRLYTQEPYT